MESEGDREFVPEKDVEGPSREEGNMNICRPQSCPRKSLSFSVNRSIPHHSKFGIEKKSASQDDDVSEDWSENTLDCDNRYFLDDAADENYNEFEASKFWCESCSRTFVNRLHFASHHRRHQAPGLFSCPNCGKGFSNLKSCYDHEVRIHGKLLNTHELVIKKGYCSNLKGTCIDSKPQVSNSVSIYKGPKVNDLLDCFTIEKQYGVPRRTVATNIVDVVTVNDNDSSDESN